MPRLACGVYDVLVGVCVGCAAVGAGCAGCPYVLVEGLGIYPPKDVPPCVLLGFNVPKAFVKSIIHPR